MVIVICMDNERTMEATAHMQIDTIIVSIMIMIIGFYCSISMHADFPFLLLSK